MGTFKIRQSPEQHLATSLQGCDKSFPAQGSVLQNRRRFDDVDWPRRVIDPPNPKGFARYSQNSGIFFARR